MDQFLSWISSHWELVSAGLFLLIGICNALSRHYTEHAGLARFLLLVVEGLSFLRSKGVPGLIKLPLQSCPPAGPADPPSAPLGVALFLTGLVALNGCAGMTATAKLEKVHQAALAASSLAEPVFRTACSTIAVACVARGARKPADCPPYLTCAKARRMVNAAIQLAHIAVIEGLALAAIGDEAGALDKLDAATKALADAWKLLRESGALGVVTDIVKGSAEAEEPSESTPPPPEGKTINEVL